MKKTSMEGGKGSTRNQMMNQEQVMTEAHMKSNLILSPYFQEKKSIK